jgi:hypothetical protein
MASEHEIPHARTHRSNHHADFRRKRSRDDIAVGNRVLRIGFCRSFDRHSVGDGAVLALFDLSGGPSCGPPVRATMAFWLRFQSLPSSGIAGRPSRSATMRGTKRYQASYRSTRTGSKCGDAFSRPTALHLWSGEPLSRVSVHLTRRLYNLTTLKQSFGPRVVSSPRPDAGKSV